MADLALANASVLTTADLSGYAATPYQKSGDIPASVKQDFATCLNAKVTIFDDTPGAQKAGSSDFKQGSTTVSSSVEIDPKRSDVDNGWNTIANPAFDRCAQQLFGAIFKRTFRAAPRSAPRRSPNSILQSVAVPPESSKNLPVISGS